MIRAEAVRQTLRGVLIHGARQLADSSPTASAFAQNAGALARPVLIRRAVEHVFRIRMFRSIDALAERLLRESDAQIADAWARYGRSESVHDRYFLRELAAAGILRETVDGMSPFPATFRLGRFVEASARQHGPVSVVLDPFWAEENSDVGSRPIIDRARALLGERAVRAATAHRMPDEHQDHGGLITDILSALIQDADNLLMAARLLDVITSLIVEYFVELDAWSRRHVVASRRKTVAMA